MKNFLCLSFYILVSLGCFAQENQIVRKGLLRAQLTLSPSFLLAQKSYSHFLHGNLEGYFNEKVSVAGEGYYYLGNYSGKNLFEFNHSTFFGLNFHITKNQNDFYLGIQPGFSFTKLNLVTIPEKPAVGGINPLASVVLGYNFFLNSFFHFFVQSRIVVGEHHYNINQSLSELRISAGLGFNLNCRK